MADDGKIKKVVRERYGELALRGLSCCQSASCCPVEIGEKIGYTETDLQAAPEGANLGLGCGNPSPWPPCLRAKRSSTWAAGRVSTVSSPPAGSAPRAG